MTDCYSNEEGRDKKKLMKRWSERSETKELLERRAEFDKKHKKVLLNTDTYKLTQAQRKIVSAWERIVDKITLSLREATHV